jgi:hypothetical protein
MTYTAAAICAPAESIKSYEHIPIFSGSGTIVRGGTLGLSDSIPFNFDLPNYATWEQYIAEEVSAETLGFQMPIKNFIATTNGAILALTVCNVYRAVQTGSTEMPHSLELLVVANITHIKNGVSKNYSTVFGRRNLSQANSFQGGFPIGLSAKDGIFTIIEQRINNEDARLIKRNSSNGLTWGSPILLSPVISLNSSLGAMVAEMLWMVGNCFSVGRYVWAALPTEGGVVDLTRKREEVNEQSYLITGKFDNVEWYNRNGEMLLCAVRANSEGCYGKILCGEDGVLRDEPWRKVPNWVPSMNRLDALYTGPKTPTIKLVLVSARASLFRYEITESNLMPDGFYYLDMEVAYLSANNFFWATNAIQQEDGDTIRTETEGEMRDLPMPGTFLLMDGDTGNIIKDLSSGLKPEDRSQWVLVEANRNYVLRLKTNLKSAFLLYISEYTNEAFD